MKTPKILILAIAFLLLMFGGSAFLNVLLYTKVKQYYVELNETRLDPVGLKNYPINPEAQTDSSQLRVVFFGDSRAAGWTFPKNDDYEFVNRGISSQTSIQASQRFVHHVQPLQPDVIVIQIGINDLKTIALFPADRDQIVADTQANIQQIVEASKRLGAIVIITTIFPTGEVPLERKPFWTDAIEEAIKDVNVFINALAEDRVIIFDAYSLLVNDQGKLLKTHEADELHLKKSGYTTLNQELLPILSTLK
ncbi:MAG: SGNH/GDSL hydrolase family protein [Leptolyngbya sp. SIO1D8]|nr:SGNH/GDSL hydrolase family protein [Leptolyngbya sp. SIO1D8]